MARISHFKIGLFFITSVAILTTGLFWIGAQDYFQATSTYVAFFDSSVQGLEAGSKVKYLGLDVGRIQSLELVSGGAQDLVQVVMALDSDFQVEEDMAVRRKLKGITGQYELSLIRIQDPDREQARDVHESASHPVIPTVPGRLERVEKAVVDLYEQTKSLDVSKLVAEWTAAARTARKALDREQVGSALTAMEKAFADISNVAGRLEQAAGSLTEGSLNAALKDLAASSQSIRRITGTVERSLGDLDPGAMGGTIRSLNQTLTNVDRSVQSAHTRVEEALRHFQQGMIRLNQVLSEIQDLARSLRTDPGRIFNRTKSRDPFQE